MTETNEAAFQAMIANLDGYITRRAIAHAAPRIDLIRAIANDVVCRAGREAERWRDVNEELKRRMRALERQVTEARDAQSRLAVALGHDGRWPPPWAVLVSEAEAQCAMAGG